MTKQSTFRRLLGYMWRYKWISLLALVFIFATTLVTTALPLLARSYIDQFVSREAATSGLYLLGIYYGLFLLRVLLTFLGQNGFERLASRFFGEVRKENFPKIKK